MGMFAFRKKKGKKRGRCIRNMINFNHCNFNFHSMIFKSYLKHFFLAGVQHSNTMADLTWTCVSHSHNFQLLSYCSKNMHKDRELSTYLKKWDVFWAVTCLRSENWNKLFHYNYIVLKKTIFNLKKKGNNTLENCNFHGQLSFSEFEFNEVSNIT